MYYILCIKGKILYFRGGGESGHVYIVDAPQVCSDALIYEVKR